MFSSKTDNTQLIYEQKRINWYDVDYGYYGRKGYKFPKPRNPKWVVAKRKEYWKSQRNTERILLCKLKEPEPSKPKHSVMWDYF